MQPTNQQLAEAFCRHDFAAVYPAMRDTVRWELIGQRVVAGKEAVRAYCAESAAYLTDVTTAFSQFTVITAGDRVVVESRATYTDREGQATTVASCDLFTFVDERLAEVVSYSVEINP